MDDGATRQRRDEVAKAAFAYRDALLAYAYALLRDWPRAEDVLQDAFLVVMDKWQEFTPGTSVYAWVRQIVHFKALEAARRRTHEPPADEQRLAAAVVAAMRDHLDEPVAEQQRLRRRALQECMARLEPAAVEILAGFYWRMDPCEKLAASQRRSVNAIRLTLSRLRTQLRECVGRRLTAGS